MNLRLRTLLVAGLVVACAGKSQRHSDAEPVGPVRDGRGLYELRIESLGDDCLPPRWVGDAGEVVVLVSTGLGPEGEGRTASIPVYDTPPDPELAAARWDVDLNGPLAFDLPRNLLPGCAAEVIQSYEIVPLAADSAHLDIQFTKSTSGPAECSDVAPYCTSSRIFHFRWLRACAASSSDWTCD